jgi:hypothetical protein
MSLARIGDRRGVAPKTISQRAKKEGWVREVPTLPLRRGRRPQPPGTPKPTAAEKRNRKLVTRLLEALDKGLTQLEARMSPEAVANAAPASAADAERDTRALTGLTQILQKLVALEKEARSAGKEDGASKTEAPENADEFRRALALRLERLNQAREPR